MFVFIQGWRPRVLKMLSKSSGKMLQTQPQWDDGGKNRWIVNLLMALLSLSLFSPLCKHKRKFLFLHSFGLQYKLSSSLSQRASSLFSLCGSVGFFLSQST